MTKPGTVSDLLGIKTRAVKDGDDWVLNGAKTFITNGINADLGDLVAQPTPQRRAGSFPPVVERGWRGSNGAAI